MWLFCQVAKKLVGKKICTILRERLEVHNSLSVEMKSATLFRGQFPFLASWQDKASGDTFVNARPLCTLEVDSHGCLLPSCPPPHPPMSQTLCPFHLYHPPHHRQHLFPHSHCIPPVIRADRHSSSAGTLAQVDQVSHLPGDCAACAHLWLSAAQLEVFSAALVCCHVR